MAHEWPPVVVLDEAGSWVHGAQEVTIPFGLLLCLENLQIIAVLLVWGKQWMRAACVWNC